MDSNKGRRRANLAQEGFVELHPMNDSQGSDMPPEVPPKDPPIVTTANKGWHWPGSSGEL
jgi:hypothetical protein